jgi:hypothetical protein
MGVKYRKHLLNDNEFPYTKGTLNSLKSSKQIGKNMTTNCYVLSIKLKNNIIHSEKINIFDYVNKDTWYSMTNNEQQEIINNIAVEWCSSLVQIKKAW